MPTLVELRQQRGAVVESMRALQAKAEAEKRELTAEERQEDDRLWAEQERLAEAVKRQERLEATERSLAERPSSGLRPEPEARREDRRAPSPIVQRWLDGAPASQRALLTRLASQEYRDAFWAHAVAGPAGISAEQRTTLQADSPTLGGFLRPPLEFVADLIQAVDNQVFLRQLATKYTVLQAEGMGSPSLDTDVDDADWTTELKTGSEGAMAFGKRELRPHPLAKSMKVSNTLLRVAAISVEQLVRDRLAYKFAVTEEKAFLTGTGSQQPLGVFTPSNDGIPTSRDVSTGNTTTAITADGLIEAKYSLKAAYWPRAAWIFSRTAIKNIRKLKDGDGQYVWRPGLQADRGDMILDSPFYISEYAPATFTTGLYVGIFGDFSRYWIVDALDLTIQRLVELYAATNQTGFIGRAETDGAPVLAEAFARVKLA